MGNSDHGTTYTYTASRVDLDVGNFGRGCNVELREDDKGRGQREEEGTPHSACAPFQFSHQQSTNSVIRNRDSLVQPRILSAHPPSAHRMHGSARKGGGRILPAHRTHGTDQIWSLPVVPEQYLDDRGPFL